MLLMAMNVLVFVNRRLGSNKLHLLMAMGCARCFYSCTTACLVFSGDSAAH